MKRQRTLWQTIARWLEPPRKLRPTRTGRWFLTGVLVVGFAAVNTGNNLLYFVLGMMLGAIIVSGLLSERNLQGVEVERAVPADAHAGSAAALAYLVTPRAGRFLPVLALEIRDRDEDGTLGPLVRIVRADRGRTRRKQYERLFARRGVVVIPEIEVATTFPFGLFRKSRRLPLLSEVRVRPRVPEVEMPEANAGHDEGHAPAPARGEGLELFGLRDLAPGDDARRIHWKATARVGRPIVKETTRDQPPSVVVRLDLGGQAGSPGIEAAVERAAGLASAFVREGFAVGLKAGEVFLTPVAGLAGREAILDALVEAAPGEQGPELDERWNVVRVGVAGVAVVGERT